MMQGLILFFGLSYYYHSRLWRDCVACQGFGRRPDIHRRNSYILCLQLSNYEVCTGVQYREATIRFHSLLRLSQAEE